MKVFTQYALVACLLIAVDFDSKAQQAQTVDMGAGYLNEVYYSFSTGVVKTSPMDNWDIAFFVNPRSAGIIVNDGNNVELYAYPKASNSGWASFDTTGKSSWTRLYNDVSNWENGAFNQMEKGHPDYGWGVYNIVTHDIVGDSLFLIRLADSSYHKLNIVSKRSINNQYEISYADVDGSNEQSFTVDISDNTKIFASFSFEDGIVDREPASSEWDMVFTRYIDTVDGLQYPLTGVLLNPVTMAAEARDVAPEFTDWSTLDYTTGRDVIGHDWKTFSMTTGVYEIMDSLFYFVKAQDGNVYKLTFESFEGTQTGITTFTTELMSTLSTEEKYTIDASVYPNPASTKLNVVTPKGEAGYVTVSNLVGKKVAHFEFAQGIARSIDISGILNGTYIVTIVSGNASKSQKMVFIK